MIVLLMIGMLMGGGVYGPEEWAKGEGLSVVVGSVTAVEPGDGPNAHTMTLVPLATICGSFDVTRVENLEIEFWYSTQAFDGGRGDFASTNRTTHMPAAGETVMAVIRQNPSGRIVVPGESFTLMAGGSGIVRVDGLGDPKVVGTVVNLREVRAATRPADKKADDAE